MDLGLKDKVAIVTGSARGLGAATARRLAQEGAKVVITDINADLAQATAQALRADGLSTLLMVLGPEEGYTFAERNGLAAFFIVRQGEGFVTRATPRFEALFPSPE